MPGADITLRFEEIYESTSKPVLAFITAKCGRMADISDIFQDTYLELCRLLNRHGAEYVTNDKALVMKIASRKVAKYYSLTARLKLFVSITSEDDEGEEVESAEALADDFLTEEFAINQVLLDSAREFIRQKPETVKKVFYLFYDVGLTIPEISRELSIGESSVKNKLYRTLKELRNFLEDPGKAETK